MGDNVIAENPDKEMVRLCSIRPRHMAEITLEDTLDSLKHNQYAIEMPEDFIKRARDSAERMQEIF